MSEDNKEVEKTVREMAKLAIFSGRISEVHLQNLKSYPFVFFNGLETVKIEYDLTHAKTDADEPVLHNPTVSYYLTIDEGHENNNLHKRFLVLESSVRNLLWKDISVEVYFNEKIVFKSKKDVRK